MKSYRNFSTLQAAEREGVDYTCILLQRGTEIAILAPHGGGIEPGTSELARAIAGRQYSCYCFEGLKESGNERLHITSTRFDEPACMHLLETCKTVVTMHGCSGEEAVVHVGGLDECLQKQCVAALLEARFEARKALPPLAGRQAGNLCNRGQSGRGVQMEISEGLRQAMFHGLNRLERQTTTPVFDTFVATIRHVLDKSPGD